MNRALLLNATMMTPLERAAGRFMRAPDHPLSGDDTGTGTGDSSATGDNTGNITDDTNANSGEDNSGLPKELEGFWEDKPDEKAGDDESEKALREQSQALGQSLGAIIDGFKGPEVFTKEIADKIADGDLTGVNEALATRDAALLKQSTLVTAKLMEGVIEKITEDFDRRIQAAFGNKDSEIALETHFPIAKDPTVRPMVQRVWDQALKNSKGDKEKAITLTRGMLNAFGSRTSLREAPDDPTAGINTSASKSLVRDLLSR